MRRKGGNRTGLFKNGFHKAAHGFRHAIRFFDIVPKGSVRDPQGYSRLALIPEFFDQSGDGFFHG